MSANEPYIGKGLQIRVTDVIQILQHHRNETLTYATIRKIGDDMDTKAQEPI